MRYDFKNILGLMFMDDFFDLKLRRVNKYTSSISVLRNEKREDWVHLGFIPDKQLSIDEFFYQALLAIPDDCTDQVREKYMVVINNINEKFRDIHNSK